MVLEVLPITRGGIGVLGGLGLRGPLDPHMDGVPGLGHLQVGALVPLLGLAVGAEAGKGTLLDLVTLLTRQEGICLGDALYTLPGIDTHHLVRFNMVEHILLEDREPTLNRFALGALVEDLAHFGSICRILSCLAGRLQQDPNHQPQGVIGPLALMLHGVYMVRVRVVADTRAGQVEKVGPVAELSTAPVRAMDNSGHPPPDPEPSQWLCPCSGGSRKGTCPYPHRSRRNGRGSPRAPPHQSKS